MGDAENVDNSRAERAARRTIRTVEKKKVEVRKVRRWIKKCGFLLRLLPKIMNV